MTQNILSTKLKNVKRELLALKTAHTRGLGSLKIYEHVEEINVPVPQQTGWWFINLMIDFDNSFPAYPFLSIIPINSGEPNYDSAFYEEIAINFTNGYHADTTVSFRYQNLPINPHPIYFYSTAPITNVDCVWWSV